MHRPRRVGMAALGIATMIAAALTGGCSKGGSRPLEPSTSTPPGVSGSPSPATSRADPISAAKREIASTNEQYDRAYFAAVGDPGNPTKTAPLLALYIPGSPEQKGMERRLHTFAVNGWAARPGPNGYVTVEKIDVVSVPPNGRATSTTCTFDDGVVYDAAHRAPDGKEIIVNDAKESVRTEFDWTWTTTSGGWKISEARTLSTWKSVNRCPPR
jgi:hypothetical protein